MKLADFNERPLRERVKFATDETTGQKFEKWRVYVTKYKSGINLCFTTGEKASIIDAVALEESELPQFYAQVALMISKLKGGMN